MGAEEVYDDFEPEQLIKEDIENRDSIPPSRDREPDYPIELNDSDNQYLESEGMESQKLRSRPNKKKSK